MGKTNLIPLLTYFTAAECEERKTAAKKAGLSISNFNRAAMGYAALKPGKPKKKTAPADLAENSISFEIVADPAETPGTFENNREAIVSDCQETIGAERIADSSTVIPVDSLLTESDIEDAFANLLGHIAGETKAEVKDEAVSEIQNADRRIERSIKSLTENLSDEKAAAETEKTPLAKKAESEKSESDLFTGNILQPDLFS